MVQDELLIEQLNQKQVGAFKILFDRFYRYLVLYAMGGETGGCRGYRAGFVRAGMGAGHAL